MALEQFEVKGWNSSIAMILSVLIAVTIYKTSIGRGYIVPTRWQGLVEQVCETVWGLVKDNIGEKGKVHYPWLFTLFTMIVVWNLMGMVPYMWSITAQISVTWVLSWTVWLGVTIRGFKEHGIDYLSMFMPQGAPIMLAPLLVAIEVISYTARAISLGLRLAANITAGHLLLAILGGGWTILPVTAVIFAMTGLELAIAVIQAYVFTLLTSIYINDAENLH